MNWKQSAKAAAKRIEELEKEIAESRYVVGMQAQDIKDYNAVIQDMIAGKSICWWCEEHNECQLNAKDGPACAQWWLRFRKPEEKTEGDQDGEAGTEAGADNSLLSLAQQGRPAADP